MLSFIFVLAKGVHERVDAVVHWHSRRPLANCGTAFHRTRVTTAVPILSRSPSRKFTGRIRRDKGVNVPKAEYAYCESIHASGSSRWHIRRLTAAGRKLGGGADTPALCGLTVAWDIGVVVGEWHNKYACPKCWKAYSTAIQAAPGDDLPPDVTK